jgi:DNA invertase Pin-like site-specific DNA recombinase
MDIGGVGVFPDGRPVPENMAGGNAPRLVPINELGLRIGEDHPNAKLTDAEVERIRSLHEDGMCYEALAEKFEVSRWTIGRICRYERRAQTVAGWKTIEE